MHRTDLTADTVRELLDYDPETGIFVWRDRPSVRGTWNTRYAGNVAGFAKKGGYVTIRINRKSYRAHRLAWLYMEESFPPSGTEIDHIDRNKSNNCWRNLRLATRAQNKANEPARSNSRTGLRGVVKRAGGKWSAHINSGGRSKNLGTFDCPVAAHITYFIEHHSRYGEFAR